eukprot:6479748-Amphidinium_carterae.1
MLKKLAMYESAICCALFSLVTHLDFHTELNQLVSSVPDIHTSELLMCSCTVALMRPCSSAWNTHFLPVRM